MKIKFNWGTGIFIFIMIFLTLAISFIIFSLQFDANLVHDDYYEKGVNYSNQIEIKKRSAEYFNNIKISENQDYIIVSFENFKTRKIENCLIHFFRHTDKKKDFKSKPNKSFDEILIAKDKLSLGRYIIKISWEMDNQQYLVEKEYSIK